MKYLVILGLCFSFVFCAEVSLSQSDFVERLINFVIFFAIFWYFGFEKIKSIFGNRTQEIADSFNRLQEQNKLLEKEKEKALEQLNQTREKAEEIVSLAKREAMIIAQQYKDKVDRDIQSISNSFEQILAQEEKRILEESIQKVLGQVGQNTSFHGDSDFYLRILRGINQ